MSWHGTEPPVDGTPTFSDAWFQIFWKVMATILTVGVVLLALRAWKYYYAKKHPQPATPSQRDPNMYATNQQAFRMWGATPGVIVAGSKTDNIYLTADKIGNFGSEQPALPEIQDASLSTTSHSKPLFSRSQAIVVAARADEASDTTDVVPEAVPYVDDSRKYQEALV